MSYHDDWGTKKDIEPFMSEVPAENIILTQTEGLPLDVRKSRRNLNTIVFGDADTGKTRSFVLPNLLQCNTSYVINDTNSFLWEKTHEMFEQNGYEVMVINVDDVDKHAGYVIESTGQFIVQKEALTSEMNKAQYLLIGNRKTAFFVNNTHQTRRELTAYIYNTILTTLFEIADNNPEKRLEVHVRFMLENFHDLGAIENFAKLFATMRPREISATIIADNLSRLEEIYPDSWETIMGNCDSMLFMGSNDEETTEYMAKAIGTKTIIDVIVKKDTRTVNIPPSCPIISPAELKKMPKDKCILLVRGTRAFYSDKYKLEKHSRYRQLNESDNKPKGLLQRIFGK